MDHAEKKAATTAFREKKAIAGIFTVRCVASGRIWVGRTPNLAAIWNRLTFSLRQGASANPSLQAAWREHGAENLVFDEVERLEDEELGFVRDSLLKDRLAHWRAVLGAKAL